MKVASLFSGCGALDLGLEEVCSSVFKSPMGMGRAGGRGIGTGILNRSPTALAMSQ